MRREIDWEIPQGIWGKQHRHIIGYGIEITAWDVYTAGNFESAAEVRLVTGNPHNWITYPNTEGGLRALQHELWRLKHVFDAGMAYKQSRILAELGVRT